MGGRRLCDVPSVGGGKRYLYCLSQWFFSNVYLLFICCAFFEFNVSLSGKGTTNLAEVKATFE